MCRDYASGEPHWEAAFDAECAGVVQHGSDVVAAFVSGEIVAVDTATGRETWRMPLHVDGELVAPLSIASAGDWLAIGLMDGRILRARIPAFDSNQAELFPA